MNELIKIQSELKAPKTQFNNFGNYKYRSCEDILEAVKPLLSKYGCILNITDEMMMLGARYYVKATAKIINAEGKEISSTAYAREEESKRGMDASQITGASSSYARKIALNGLLCIDDNRDSDTTNTGEEKKSTPAPAKKTANTTELQDAIAKVNAVSSREALVEVVKSYKDDKEIINNVAFIKAINDNKYASK